VGALGTVYSPVFECAFVLEITFFIFNFDPRFVTKSMQSYGALPFYDTLINLLERNDDVIIGATVCC
jgi:hypothetical protein